MNAPAAESHDATPARAARVGVRRALPGFLPALGFSWLYVSVLVLLPLAGLVVRAAGTPPARIVEIVTAPRTAAALKLSFSIAFAAALINALFGVVVAWVLARYRFPGRTLLDSLVELPFALPTSVAGITLALLYSEQGWFGRVLAPLGIRVAFTPLGILLALVFVGLPFVVRTVQPVIEELDVQLEQAARSLGATRAQAFWYVQFPLILPSIVTGFALALARAIGEYGSVLFISGNMPMRTEIAPLLIVTKLEQFDYEGAALIAAVMLLVSLLVLILVHFIERWTASRLEAGSVA